MKTRPTIYHKYKIFIVALFAFVSVQLLCVSSAHSQIDFYYGKNVQGLRVGMGPGITNLITHYSSFPTSFTFVTDIDYAFNPYFSMGINAQFGKLVGTDNTNNFYFQTSTDSYAYGNFNIKAGVGLISDFSPQTRLQDALKRLYLGLGIGEISTNNVITINKNVSLSTVYNDPDNTITNITTNPTGPKMKGTLSVISFDLGTYIDMPGLWGTDKVEICPNYQFNYTGAYLDGFKTSAKNTAGGVFNITSVTLRYKF